MQTATKRIGTAQTLRHKITSYTRIILLLSLFCFFSSAPVYGACPSDVNSDSYVDGLDIVTVAYQYGSTDCPTPEDCTADIDGDNDVDDADLQRFAEEFGRTGCVAQTVVGGTISVDTTWTPSGSPYIVTSGIVIRGKDGPDEITTLTIEPGVVVSFNAGRGMIIGWSSGDPGALSAIGTAANLITFTSNATSPSSGDWCTITFSDTTYDATTVMEHCIVEYGGCEFAALYLNNAAPRIENTTVRNCGSTGLYAAGSGTENAFVSCNTFTGNQNGIYWTASPPPEMHGNNFIGNIDYGLYYSGAQTLNAEYNWWGDTAGPNTGGDRTYGIVDADPWFTVQSLCDPGAPNNPPNPPNTPTPADNAVRISIDGALSVSWAGGDPDPIDSTSYDIYRGVTADNLLIYENNSSDNICLMDDLYPGITYFWKVVSRDSQGLETSGPIWRFTTVGAPPDLVITQVTTNPAGNLQPGQNVTITATAQNLGSGPVVDSFEVEILVDSSSIGAETIDEIMLSEDNAQVVWTWAYTGGDPAIEIVADSQSTVSETNESNNRFNANFSEVADNTAPELVAILPVDGSYLQQLQQQVSVTLTDSQSEVDDAAVLASFVVIDSNSQSVAGTKSESDDIFNFVPNTLPLADGEYQVSLTAIDTLGNSRDYTAVFTIDTQPPAKPVITGGTVTSGTIQARPAQNSSTDFIIELEGTREGGTAVWINSTQQVETGDSAWSLPVVLSMGENNLEVWLMDLAGNQGPSEQVDISVIPGSGCTFQYNASGRLSRVVSD